MIFENMAQRDLTFFKTARGPKNAHPWSTRYQDKNFKILAYTLSNQTRNFKFALFKTSWGYAYSYYQMFLLSLSEDGRTGTPLLNLAR